MHDRVPRDLSLRFTVALEHLRAFFLFKETTSATPLRCQHFRRRKRHDREPRPSFLERPRRSCKLFPMLFPFVEALGDIPFSLSFLVRRDLNRHFLASLQFLLRATTQRVDIEQPRALRPRYRCTHVFGFSIVYQFTPESTF